MSAGNPHPYGSDAWKAHNAAEVASRPTAILNRQPFTPQELEALRSGTSMEDIVAGRKQRN